MAAPNLDQLVASTWDRVVGDSPVDNKFNEFWMFDQLTSKNGGVVKVDGGATIQVPIEYANNTTFRSYSDMETLDVNRVDVFDAASYNWKEHGGTLVISQLEKFRNMGDSAKFDLLSGKIDNAMKSAKDNINTALFADGTARATDLHGIKLLVPADPTTSTSVGGINQNTFSFWRSKTLDDTGASGSTLRASMRTMYNNCSAGAFADHPTFGVTDQPSFELYESLLTANERYTDKSKGDAGFENDVLKFKGMKLAYDPACTAGNMYFLNPKYLKLYVAKSIFLKLGEPIEPTNQTVSVRKITSILQLIATNRRRLGVITTIA